MNHKKNIPTHPAAMTPAERQRHTARKLTEAVEAVAMATAAFVALIYFLFL